MVDGRCDPRLAQEALSEGVVAGELGCDQLQRDRTIEGELGRPIHDTHPTPADNVLRFDSRRIGFLPRARRGQILDPWIDHVKRVSVACGAMPLGRSPRRTSTVGAGGVSTSARRVSPSPSVRQRSESPRTRRPAPSRERGHALEARRAEQRLGDDARRVLDDQRRIREQPARVAAARRPDPSPRSDAEAAREPAAAQAPSSSAAQSCSNAPNGTTIASGREGASALDEHREIRGRLLEDRRQRPCERVADRRQQEQIGVLLLPEPDDVLGRGRGGERSHTDRGASLCEVAPGCVELRRSQPTAPPLGRSDRGPAHGAVGPRASASASGSSRSRPAALSGTATIDRSASYGRPGVSERRILAQDRPLQLAQLRARVEAELLVEQPLALAIHIERLGLAARPVQRAHEEQRAAAPAAGAPRRAPAAPRRARVHRRARAPPRCGSSMRELTQLAETRGLRLDEGLVLEVGERRAPPERERLAQRRRTRPPRLRPTRVASSRSNSCRSSSPGATRST